MHDFKVKKGELYCESSRVADIADSVGTPFYLYSQHTIEDHFLKLKRAFKDYDTCICYSVKANSNLSILKILAALGAGADIVSGGELYRAQQANFLPQKIVYSGVGKTSEEIEAALKAKILMFNVESREELQNINQIAHKLNTKAGIAFRVNLDIDAKTHAFTTTGKKENKFGIPLEDALKLYPYAKKLSHVIPKGIDVHLGSPIVTIDPYLKALDKLAQAVSQLKAMGINLEYLDLGGGLGIIYKDETPLTADEFANHVISPVRAIGLKLIIEPGRFIVGNAGILVTKILYLKETEALTFAIVDGGMNDLIRPPLYGGYHEIIPSKEREGEQKTYDVVGPICESADFFGKGRELPPLKQGDYLAVMSSGAYGFTMSSNYNSRPRPSEVLVHNGSHRIIRKRETYESLIFGET